MEEDLGSQLTTLVMVQGWVGVGDGSGVANIWLQRSQGEGSDEGSVQVSQQ